RLLHLPGTDLRRVVDGPPPWRERTQPDVQPARSIDVSDMREVNVVLADLGAEGQRRLAIQLDLLELAGPGKVGVLPGDVHRSGRQHVRGDLQLVIRRDEVAGLPEIQWL